MWDSFSARGLYGLTAAVPQSAHLDHSPGIATASGPSLTDDARPWSPEHPLFVFGVLLAAAAGLIGFAGSARLGPAKAGVSVGKS